ncbi:DUF4099 domain-containing protein [Paraflavisolibacter sp. H34]|uniref:DUF4099 domain-containing protein n=1 Tax=Huijunlia imazamoxiresistens TaxID=3127457 RepID=UPI00301A93DF
MFKMKFEAQELPFDQFKQIGFDRDRVLKLPSVELSALLSGRRTSLIHIKEIQVEGGGVIPDLDVKLSLGRNPDGAAVLRYHPVLNEPPNVFNLSAEEMEDLVQNRRDTLEKEFTWSNGRRENFLVQYDPETREFVGKPISDIVLPRQINNITLTEGQREDWCHGRTVEVGGEKIRLDLRNVLGFSGKASTFVLDNGLKISVAGLLQEVEKYQKQAPGRGEKPSAPKHSQQNRGPHR